MAIIKKDGDVFAPVPGVPIYWLFVSIPKNAQDID